MSKPVHVAPLTTLMRLVVTWESAALTRIVSQNGGLLKRYRKRHQAGAVQWHCRILEGRGLKWCIEGCGHGARASCASQVVHETRNGDAVRKRKPPQPPGCVPTLRAGKDRLHDSLQPKYLTRHDYLQPLGIELPCCSREEYSGSGSKRESTISGQQMWEVVVTQPAQAIVSLLPSFKGAPVG